MVIVQLFGQLPIGELLFVDSLGDSPRQRSLCLHASGAVDRKWSFLGGNKENPRRSFLIGVACLTGAAAVANATTVQRTDTATLVSMAKLVVHGTVIGNEVVYDDGPNGPANVPTITTIQVTESFKGDAGETVTVAGFGGQSIGFLTQGRGAPRPSLEGVWYSRENFRSSRSLSTVNIFQ